MARARSAMVTRLLSLAALGRKQRQRSAAASESSPDGAAPAGILALPRAEPLARREEVSVARGATYAGCLARTLRTDGQTHTIQSWPLSGDTGSRGAVVAAAAAADSSKARRMVSPLLSRLVTVVVRMFLWGRKMREGPSPHFLYPVPDSAKQN